jgi:hypothetical protein
MMSLRRPSSTDTPLQLCSAIFTDVPLRDTQETMEVPFLSLSKRPRFEPIKFTTPEGMSMPLGLRHTPRIFEADVVIHVS